jgi:multidrug efflux system membrane fusion protein
MNRASWIMMVVPLLASAAATGCQQAKSGPPRATPLATYDLPVTRTVTDYVDFPGTTDARISVQIRARVSGYLTQHYFTDGDMVEEGNLLFQIDPRQYQAEFDRAEGNVQQIEAHRRRLEKEYHRARNLLAMAKVSQEEYDRYEADYKETEANLRLAIANRDLARLNLDWCQVKAPSAGLLSRRMVDPGNLIKADDTVLTSLVSLDPMYVYFEVDEQSMLRITRLIHEGKIKVKAQGEKAVPVQIGLSDEEDYPHEGVVNFTDNRVDSTTGTLRFRATIPNPADRAGNRFIVPGLFVRVRLPIGEPHPALMIRERALVSDQGQKGVFLVKDKINKEGTPEVDEKTGKTKLVAIWSKVGTPGVLRDGYLEINEGVKLGDRVVVSGMQRLRHDIEVMAVPYAESPATADASAKKDASAPAKSQPAEANNDPRPAPVNQPGDPTKKNNAPVASPSAGAGDLKTAPGNEETGPTRVAGNASLLAGEARASGNRPPVPPAQPTAERTGARAGAESRRSPD